MMNASEGSIPIRPMKKFIAAAFAALALATPAQAATHGQVIQLLKTIEQTGTKISFNSNAFDKSCNDNAGYYVYKQGVSDLLVVCTDQVDIRNPSALWEVAAHEATHVMQTCIGGLVFGERELAGTVRELNTYAPHYAKLVRDDYQAKDAPLEAEAFWMEMQPVQDVIGYVRAACKR
jgi:hypothetical protein